jgi:hypothetical protein
LFAMHFLSLTVKYFCPPFPFRISEISLFLKNFVVRSVPNSRQTHVYVMRYSLTHDKLMSLEFVVHFLFLHNKVFFTLKYFS